MHLISIMMKAKRSIVGRQDRRLGPCWKSLHHFWNCTLIT